MKKIFKKFGKNEENPLLFPLKYVSVILSY